MGGRALAAGYLVRVRAGGRKGGYLVRVRAVNAEGAGEWSDAPLVLRTKLEARRLIPFGDADAGRALSLRGSRTASHDARAPSVRAAAEAEARPKRG
jgi:hypothetical protein